jgi:hypothetical protein
VTPRWKIRRESDPLWGRYRWALHLDGKRVDSYFVWENAITHIDNWYHDQTLRSEP